MTTQAERIAHIKELVNDPVLQPMRTVARMAKAISGIMLESGDAGEIEAQLIAKGFSLGEIKSSLGMALIIIQEFGRKI